MDYTYHLVGALASIFFVLIIVSRVLRLIFRTGDSKDAGTQATSDRVLVRPIKQSTEIQGLARAETSVGRSVQGVVVLVGPGKFTELGKRLPMEVEVGDKVSFAAYAGTDIVNPQGLDAGTYLMLRQDEILLNHGPEDNS